MFQGGCPMCGYSAPPQPPSKKRSKKNRRQKETDSYDQPSIWTYIIPIIFIAAIIAFLSYFITR